MLIYNHYVLPHMTDIDAVRDKIKEIHQNYVELTKIMSEVYFDYPDKAKFAQANALVGMSQSMLVFVNDTLLK